MNQAQAFQEPAEELSMLANQPYESMSLVGFQLSFLNLAAALELPAPFGVKQVSSEAAVEVEQLQELAGHHRRCA